MRLSFINPHLKQLNNHSCFHMYLGINSEQSDRMSVLQQIQKAVFY
jgi:hypothetical protein